jgi:hypothetical protein
VKTRARIAFEFPRIYISGHPRFCMVMRPGVPGPPPTVGGGPLGVEIRTSTGRRSHLALLALVPARNAGRIDIHLRTVASPG